MIFYLGLSEEMFSVFKFCIASARRLDEWMGDYVTNDIAFGKEASTSRTRH